jgi:hypothetical protein
MVSYHLPLWRGYARRYEKTSQKPLRDTLKSASRQLIKLKLSRGDQFDSIDKAQTLKDNEEVHNFFARNVLRISLEKHAQVFPTLYFSFEWAPEERARVFNFSILRSLRLRLYPGLEDFHEYGSRINSSFGPKSLELQSTNENELRDGAGTFQRSY